jgi:hypothetical protein
MSHNAHAGSNNQGRELPQRLLPTHQHMHSDGLPRLGAMVGHRPVESASPFQVMRPSDLDLVAAPNRVTHADVP